MVLPAEKICTLYHTDYNDMLLLTYFYNVNEIMCMN